MEPNSITDADSRSASTRSISDLSHTPPTSRVEISASSGVNEHTARMATLTPTKPLIVADGIGLASAVSARTNETPTTACEAAERDHADSLVHYVVIRADLSHGAQVAQAVHAAGESISGPLPSGTVAVALAARNRVHLEELAQRLTSASIGHKVIFECDGEPMAIGVTPTRDRAAVRKVLSSIPLVR